MAGATSVHGEFARPVPSAPHRTRGSLPPERDHSVCGLSRRLASSRHTPRLGGFSARLACSGGSRLGCLYSTGLCRAAGLRRANTSGAARSPAPGLVSAPPPAACPARTYQPPPPACSEGSHTHACTHACTPVHTHTYKHAHTYARIHARAHAGRQAGRQGERGGGGLEEVVVVGVGGDHDDGQRRRVQLAQLDAHLPPKPPHPRYPGPRARRRHTHPSVSPSRSRSLAREQERALLLSVSIPRRL